MSRRAAEPGDIRTGLEPAVIARAFGTTKLRAQAWFARVATRNDNYMALALTVRGPPFAALDPHRGKPISPNKAGQSAISRPNSSWSATGDNLVNLGIYDRVSAAMTKAGLDLDDLLERKPNRPRQWRSPAASPPVSSIHSPHPNSIPGYGIRYEFGIFDQSIRDGWRVNTHRQNGCGSAIRGDPQTGNRV